MLVCKFCASNRKNANSLRNHERLCKQNPERQLSVAERPDFHLNKRQGNQFTTGRVARHSAETINKIRTSNVKTWSDPNRREKQSKTKIELMPLIVQRYPDSYSFKNVSGRSKRSTYNGEFFHSSWEVLVAKWLDSLKIVWIRKIDGIKYFWNGKEKTYFPDFYLPTLNLFVEVKGYETDRDKCKWAMVPNLVLIKKREIDLIRQGILSPSILRGREHPS